MNKSTNSYKDTEIVLQDQMNEWRYFISNNLQYIASFYADVVVYLIRALSNYSDNSVLNNESFVVILVYANMNMSYSSTYIFRGILSFLDSFFIFGLVARLV